VNAKEFKPKQRFYDISHMPTQVGKVMPEDVGAEINKDFGKAGFNMPKMPAQTIPTQPKQ